MDRFIHADVKLLSGLRDPWCVSIFLPTHRTGAQMQQDPIRLKNLLAEAEGQLLAAGRRTPEVHELLRPAKSLLTDGDFWQHQSDGLAVFAAAGHFHTFRVPLDLRELVVVAPRFQLKPLFPFLTGDGHFFILALSQNEVRLLEATRHSVDDIALARLPGNLRDALGLDQQEKQLQYHTRAPERGGRRAAVFHGQGPGQEQTKEQLEKFFRRIDEPLCDYLREDRAPLVLAGVDYYFPIYRRVTRYAQLVERGVSGNPEPARPEELHDRAWPLVEPHFTEAREAALARYHQLEAAGRATTHVSQIVAAAHQGRVEVLFVATDRQQWGTFSPDTLEVTLQETATAHNEDLLDQAAVAAYLSGAVVYAMPSQQLPAAASAAAIYRF